MHPEKGEGTVSVGRPNLVHISKLRQATTSAPANMNDSDLEALMEEIGKYFLLLPLFVDVKTDWW